MSSLVQGCVLFTICVALADGSDKVRLVFHLFPLPYHQYGFTAAQAGVVVLNSTDAEGFFRFQEEAFKMQELLWNEAAQGYTQPQVAHVLKPLALKAGVSEAQWKQGMGEGHGRTPADSVSDSCLFLMPPKSD